MTVHETWQERQSDAQRDRNVVFLTSWYLKNHLSVSVCVRYEKQLQEEEQSLQQQRRRLYKEVADEKERLAELAAR